MFGGSRGRGLDFADIVVSIPPAGARQPGDVSLPSSLPANPERDFVILRADRMDLAQAKANFDARIKRMPGRRVLIFVHGFNTRFEEAVYRFAQIVHDARVDVAPVLFTWPSGGRVTDYVYDRDSAVYSRDALEAVLQALVKDPNVDSISILAHSMGNYLAIESLRQMSIRDHGLSPKIRDVMLASPDIDVDVFRRQIAEIDAGPRPAQFTLFISRDDRALGLSSFLARDSTRLGALDPRQGALPLDPGARQGASRRPDRHGLQRLPNHGKFASGEVVGAIGATAGGGPVALRGQGRSGRIARHVHEWRDQCRRRRRHWRRRRAGRDPRSDEAREVGRHCGASDDFEPVIRSVSVSAVKAEVRLEAVARVSVLIKRFLAPNSDWR